MTPKEAVSNYWRAYTEHNLDKMLSMLAPEFVLRSPFSQGKAATKDMVAMGFKMFDESLPDLKEEVMSITAEGEVVETATFTGPMQGPGEVIAPTNRSYRLLFSAFFRVNDQGLIIEQQNYWDTADWIRQIGIDPKLFAPKAEPSE
jgi:steroid delta-isomerase-like uncharacterized protein